jgi:hypothetical protein
MEDVNKGEENEQKTKISDIDLDLTLEKIAQSVHLKPFSILLMSSEYPVNRKVKELTQRDSLTL